VNETLYINVGQNIEVHKKEIFLGDIADLWCQDKTVLAKCKAIKLLTINSDKNTRSVISIMKVIELIQKMDSKIQVTNLGEADFIIDYRIPHKPNHLMQWVKTIIICIITFCGAAFAIMTFNNDGNVQNIFDEMYFLVMGYQPEGFTILELSYSIGLAIGIIIFFNHFKWKTMVLDPTPIEVKMRLYEKEVNEALIQNANREETEIDIH